MEKGIQVVWRSRQIDEIEYFYGIDVQRLDDIPEFNRVHAVWPQYGRSVEYAVDVRCDRNRPDEVRLIVSYEQEENSEIVQIAKELKLSHDNYWGTNTIVLRQGSRRGDYKWLPPDKNTLEGQWVAFDLGAAGARPGFTYRGSKREDAFRAIVLGCDDHRCVLTGERTRNALDAAHLIPAANGENDVPCNGITLRADLHRLFDAGRFSIGTDGQVVAIDPELSSAYRRLLRNRSLPPPTLGRVAVTLARPQFQDRRRAR